MQLHSQMHNSITVHETRENIHLFCTYTIFLRAFLLNINPHEVQKLICVNQRGNVDIYQSRFFEHFLRRIILYVFILFIEKFCIFRYGYKIHCQLCPKTFYKSTSCAGDQSSVPSLCFQCSPAPRGYKEMSSILADQ